MKLKRPAIGSGTVYKADGTNVVLESKPSFEDVQVLVGGYVQIITLMGVAQMCVDEDGLQRGKPTNKAATEMARGVAYMDPYHGIVGDVVVLRGSWRAH